MVLRVESRSSTKGLHSSNTVLHQNCFCQKLIEGQGRKQSHRQWRGKPSNLELLISTGQSYPFNSLVILTLFGQCSEWDPGARGYSSDGLPHHPSDQRLEPREYISPLSKPHRPSSERQKCFLNSQILGQLLKADFPPDNLVIQSNVFLLRTH